MATGLSRWPLACCPFKQAAGSGPLPFYMRRSPDHKAGCCMCSAAATAGAPSNSTLRVEAIGPAPKKTPAACVYVVPGVAALVAAGSRSGRSVRGKQVRLMLYGAPLHTHTQDWLFLAAITLVLACRRWLRPLLPHSNNSALSSAFPHMRSRSAAAVPAFLWFPSMRSTPQPSLQS